MTRFNSSLALAGAFAVSMFASIGQAYTPEQQRLCIDDALRLCGPEVPDVDRITACMIRQRELLSAGCKAFFHDEPVVAPKASKKLGPAPVKKPPVGRSQTGQ